MLRKPRFRNLILLVAVVGVLLGPAAPSDAQTVDTTGTDVPAAVEAHAVVIGTTQPPADPHNLGINRVAGPSKFAGTQISAVVVCTETNSVHAGTLEQPAGSFVHFTADDDVTDGFGEIATTPTADEFQGEDEIGQGDITARIVEGRFHRLFGIVEVDLTLDLRVTDPGGAEICHDSNLPFRLVLHLLPQSDPPGGEGFTLAGIGRRHHRVHFRVLGRLVHVNIDDRIAVSRIACDLVSPYSTRVTEPPIVTTTSTPIGPGRGDFHPCSADDYERIEDYVTVESD